MAETAKLVIGGKELELPVVEGTEGEKAIDITQLRAKTGYITLDPGFGNTGACESTITFIDGEKGILRYRGIPIEQLTDKPDFVEVAWLIIFGTLPTVNELAAFRRKLAAHADIHEAMKYHFEGFPSGAPPMAMLSAMINSLACFHQQFLKLEDNGLFEEAAARLISKVRTIAAYAYRSANGLPYVYPDPNLSYAGNFLHMMFSMPHERYAIDPDVEDALNLVLLLHADHEQNCSTSTVRMVGSARANLFASVAAGVCALWGPLHGGANVEVLDMLEGIHKGGMTAEEYVAKAKDKGSTVRLMGFGHRVYKNFDPRAQILKKSCDRVLARLGRKDPLLDIARRLEEQALSDPYFIERKLYPNVDFYSGIIFRAIGIPVDMFTVMFAIGRLPGWIAQWKENHGDPQAKISRPRQVFTGPVGRSFVPIDQRGT
jgi:citrate synthase